MVLIPSCSLQSIFDIEKEIKLPTPKSQDHLFIESKTEKAHGFSLSVSYDYIRLTKTYNTLYNLLLSHSNKVPFAQLVRLML
jgi:hypothetical protein